MQEADRMQGLSSAIFTTMDTFYKQLVAEGKDVINLGIGSPDQPPAPHIIQALAEGIANPRHYGYPLSKGTPAFREAVARWYGERFGVALDPETEVLALMGSQDGLAHLSLCYLNPGDVILVPDPGYPIYSAGPLLAGGALHFMPLRPENGYLPDFGAIDATVRKRAKLMLLNYPNNPLAAIADRNFFAQAVDFARVNDIILCHDLAYSELAFDGYCPPSVLEIPGAKEVAVEFHSLSKTYNMAGCRLGFVVGNPRVISALARLKSNIDYGVFLPVQQAGVAALTGPQDCVRQTASRYQKRRDLMVEGLAAAGWNVPKPKASMYLWAPLPVKKNSYDFSIDLLTKAGVLVIPGNAFGACGEGFVRIALVAEEDRLARVIERIRTYLAQL